MEKEFMELFYKIELCKNQKDYDELIESWEIANEDMDKWIDTIWKESDKIDAEKMPYVLEALYKQHDQFKFILFCMMLEKHANTIPFLTPLESIPIYKAKYEVLLPTLAKVASASYGGIADCLYLIFLNSDPEGTLLKEEDRQVLVEGINKKLPIIKKYYLDGKHEIPDNVRTALEILLDVSCYINNEETLKLIQEFNDLPLRADEQIFLLKTEAINDIEMNKDHLIEIANSERDAYRILSAMEGAGREDLLKDANMTQEKVALSNMIRWLEYPTELGDTLDEISLVDTMEIENIVFYIYKFTSVKDELKDRGYMVGISGGFPKDKVTTVNTGDTFSKFERIEEDYKEQAIEIIKLLATCRAEQNKQ